MLLNGEGNIMKNRNYIVRFAAVAVFVISACMILSACGQKLPYDGLNMDDYIKVGEYKGLTVEADYDKVTDEDVKAKIDEALSQAGTPEDLKKGDEIKDGDTANIDFVGKIDGKEFEGGSAEGHELQIGSHSFIDGFESGLIGCKVGDEVDLDLTFPKDYGSKDLAGKDVVFEVKINSAKRTVTPKYDDAFIKNNTTYNNKEDYEESLKKTIKEEKQASKKNELWSQILDSSEVKKYPKDRVKKYQDGYNKQIDMTAEQAGVERSQLIAQYGATDEKAMSKIIKDESQAAVKNEMVIQAIADKEELSYTNKELKSEVDDAVKNLKSQGYDEEKYQELTGKTVAEDAHFNLLSKKVMDFVMENIKVGK